MIAQLTNNTFETSSKVYKWTAEFVDGLWVVTTENLKHANARHLPKAFISLNELEQKIKAFKGLSKLLK